MSAESDGKRDSDKSIGVNFGEDENIVHSNVNDETDKSNDVQLKQIASPERNDQRIDQFQDKHDYDKEAKQDPEIKETESIIVKQAKDYVSVDYFRNIDGEVIISDIDESDSYKNSISRSSVNSGNAIANLAHQKIDEKEMHSRNIDEIIVHKPAENHENERTKTSNSRERLNSDLRETNCLLGEELNKATDEDIKPRTGSSSKRDTVNNKEQMTSDQPRDTNEIFSDSILTRSRYVL